MKKQILSALMFAALCLLLCPQQAEAQYAYGASGIGYDSATKIVYGYSRTSVDYYAGTYYDPYVEGFLFGPFGLHDYGYNRGYESYFPAVVETDTFSAPSTRYDVISDHYVISYYSVSVTICDYWGFGPGCGYDPYGFSFFGGQFGGFNYFNGWDYYGYVPERTYYLGSTGIAGITPPAEDPCNSSSGATAAASSGSSDGATQYEPSSSGSRDTVALAGESCPVPPTPKVTVSEVGFKNDYKITRWAEGVAANQTVIDPDDNAATWVKGRGSNDDYPVAYKVGARPTLFAKLTITNGDNKSGRIRAKKGSLVITGEYPISVSNGTVSLNDIPLTAGLEATPKVKRSKYDFSWEVQFEGSSEWKSAGSSGDHEIHWLYGDPLKPEFTNAAKRTFSGLFDRALDHATGEMGDGASDIAAIVKKINQEEASDITYNPSRPSEELDHPLALYDGREAQCSDNAELLRGLLRSIGIDATTKYYWGGDPASGKQYNYQFAGAQFSLQTDRPQLTEGTRVIEEDPHFTFHSLITTNGKFYDPSYGIEEDNVRFLETFDNPTRTFRRADDVNLNLVIRDRNRLVSEEEVPSAERCPHNANIRPNLTAFVTQSVPTSMEVGQTYNVSVTMRNTGESTWTEADLYRLGAQSPQDNYTWGMNRVMLPASVAPGAEVTFNFYVTAPSTAGSYNFQWQMVRDGVEWFGEMTPNAVVNVTGSYDYCDPDPWEEQNCYSYGGYWDYTNCSCSYYYYY